VFSLAQGGLDRAALRLFGDGATDTDGLDPQARYLLGNIAETRGDPVAAARFWQGLATPPNVVAEEWQVRLAAAQWGARMPDAATATVRALAKSGKPLPAPAVTRAVALARDMRDAGRPELAQETLAALLPLAGRAESRGVLQLLGELAESGGQYARAADYYLRAALANSTGDAVALQARLAAGINLARAGYKEDARAQFQWLIQNSKDAAQRDAARRELSRL
jgi:tetratricopeptide (TPR) repeat protein